MGCPVRPKYGGAARARPLRLVQFLSLLGMTTDLSHEVEVVPAFHDIDPMEIVWHGHYVKYLEVARTALLGKFGYDYPRMRESGYGWPVVDMRLKYVRPAEFGQ